MVNEWLDSVFVCFVPKTGIWPSGVFPQLLGGQLVNQFSLDFLVVALQPLCLCFRFVQLNFFHTVYSVQLAAWSYYYVMLFGMKYPIKPLPCLRATEISNKATAMPQGYCIYSKVTIVTFCPFSSVTYSE